MTCGGGTQERNRTISQTALNNGTDCTGNDTETQSCNSNGCPGNIQLNHLKAATSQTYDFHFYQLTAPGEHGVHGKHAL